MVGLTVKLNPLANLPWVGRAPPRQSLGGGAAKACSQTLYFLFKVRRARVIKKKNREGFIDRQRKELWEGEEENHLLFPGKANYHWLNGDYPVTIMSTTHHFRVMRVEAFVIAWTR